MTEAPSTEYTVKRRSRRVSIARPVRVRPSEPRDIHFEDLPVSVNASKEGIYFTSRRDSYYLGMRVFVTFPFSSAHDPMNCEYIAQGASRKTSEREVWRGHTSANDGELQRRAERLSGRSEHCAPKTRAVHSLRNLRTGLNAGRLSHRFSLETLSRGALFSRRVHRPRFWQD